MEEQRAYRNEQVLKLLKPKPKKRKKKKKVAKPVEQEEAPKEE